MRVRLVNNDGSGSVGNESPISYSYSEDVTSLEPSNLSGGAGQVSVSAIAVEENKVGNTHPNSKLLINNNMSLIHEDSGEVQFKVKQASVNAGVVSIVGETLQGRLNVERTAGPHGGSGATIYTALVYYCGLVGIIPTFEDGLDTTLDTIPVNFIGWKGNVWEHLKMLCAAVSISTTDNIGLEFYVDSTGLIFRTAKLQSAEFLERSIVSQAISVDSLEGAQEVNIANYNTSYGINKVVQDVSANADNLSSTSAQGASIYDGLQVNAGEKLVKRFTINASLESINQPSVVDGILPFPYTGGTGQYAIAGADGIFVKASQWTGEGGKLTVALTENPNEIEVTVIAPVKNGLENITGGGALSYEPYKIGIETSGSTDYPAIYITGTGVFYKKTQHEIKTGASDQYTSQQTAVAIDNPFITNDTAVYSRGAAAAQVICGPNITLSETVSTVEPFGSTPGKIRTVNNNKYRITSVNYGADTTSLTAKPVTSFTDFDDLWTGQTFSDFKSTALDPALYPESSMKFNEFTVIPLMTPEGA